MTLTDILLVIGVVIVLVSAIIDIFEMRSRREHIDAIKSWTTDLSQYLERVNAAHAKMDLLNHQLKSYKGGGQ